MFDPYTAATDKLIADRVKPDWQQRLESEEFAALDRELESVIDKIKEGLMR